MQRLLIAPLALALIGCQATVRDSVHQRPISRTRTVVAESESLAAYGEINGRDLEDWSLLVRVARASLKHDSESSTLMTSVRSESELSKAHRNARALGLATGIMLSSVGAGALLLAPSQSEERPKDEVTGEDADFSPRENVYTYAEVGLICGLPILSISAWNSLMHRDRERRLRDTSRIDSKYSSSIVSSQPAANVSVSATIGDKRIFLGKSDPLGILRVPIAALPLPSSWDESTREIVLHANGTEAGRVPVPDAVATYMQDGAQALADPRRLQDFVAKHPKAPIPSIARDQLKQQEDRDDLDFEAASRPASINSLRRYLAAHPDGRHAEKAQRTIQTLDLQQNGMDPLTLLRLARVDPSPIQAEAQTRLGSLYSRQVGAAASQNEVERAFALGSMAENLGIPTRVRVQGAPRDFSNSDDACRVAADRIEISQFSGSAFEKNKGRFVELGPLKVLRRDERELELHPPESSAFPMRLMVRLPRRKTPFDITGASEVFVLGRILEKENRTSIRTTVTIDAWWVRDASLGSICQ